MGKSGMEHVFGPVPSRRLGRSLGVDPIPLKTCNWNCVYCQLGRTAPLTGQRAVYAPAEKIVAEVETALRHIPSGGLDWVTFVGSGEPALHENLGWMIRRVKAMTDTPVAVITNGSLLYRPDVREEISSADAVLPTLDGGTSELFRAINRPHPAFTFGSLISGLTSFRREYRGKLLIEVMLVRDLNDHQEALEDIASILSEIQPDEVHISLPLRPPAEPWAQPATQEGLARATVILGAVARVLPPIPEGFEVVASENLVEAVIGVISRHPMEEEDLVRSLASWERGHVREVLSELRATGRAQVVMRLGRRFWTGAEARFGGVGDRPEAAP